MNNPFWKRSIRILPIATLAALFLVTPQVSGWQGDDAKNDDAPTQTADNDERNTPRESSAMRVSKRSRALRGLFGTANFEARQSTVKIISNKSNRQIALGMVVDANGFILTKKSELRPNISCRLLNGDSYPAYVYGIHKQSDLALLKIDAEDLKVVPWAEEDAPAAGSWLVTTDATELPIGIGVVSVGPRKIAPVRGFLGVVPVDSDDGVVLSNLQADAPAIKSGLRNGDLVRKIGGTPIKNAAHLIEVVGKYRPGDKIRVQVERNDKELVYEVTLGSRRELLAMNERSNQQNTMGGSLSRRREDFELALQHDTYLKPNQCGGPICNLQGSVIGINIARSGRVETLVLTKSAILPIIDELKTGLLNPAVVNKDRINMITQRLDELELTLAIAPEKATSLEEDLNELKQKEKEALGAIKKAQQELQEAIEARTEMEMKYKDAVQLAEDAEKEKQRLTREREQLTTGSTR